MAATRMPAGSTLKMRWYVATSVISTEPNSNPLKRTFRTTAIHTSRPWLIARRQPAKIASTPIRKKGACNPLKRTFREFSIGPLKRTFRCLAV
jgi:hypothetical protein